MSTATIFQGLPDGMFVSAIFEGAGGLEAWQVEHAWQYCSMSHNIPTQYPTCRIRPAVLSGPKCPA